MYDGRTRRVFQEAMPGPAATTWRCADDLGPSPGRPAGSGLALGGAPDGLDRGGQALRAHRLLDPVAGRRVGDEGELAEDHTVVGELDLQDRRRGVVVHHVEGDQLRVHRRGGVQPGGPGQPGQEQDGDGDRRDQHASSAPRRRGAVAVGRHNISDVEALCAVQDEGIEGVICGRSIYEGTLDLNTAQLRADELTEGSVNFTELRDAGDPVEIARRYDQQGADELTFLDITASSDNRGLILDIIEAVASQVFIPLTVGGGVREVADVRRLLNAGADKV
eukprot:gene28216-31872_t